jgi:hypothetical protein
MVCVLTWPSITLSTGLHGGSEIKESSDESAQLLSKAFSDMGIPGINEMSPNRVKHLWKDAAWAILHDALRLIQEFSSVLCKDLQAAPNSVNNHLLASQHTIIAVGTSWL